MDPDQDQRIDPRLPFVLRVVLKDREGLLAASENLSRGGLFLQTDQPLALGARVRLTLSFPGLLDPVEVRGVVTWARPMSPEVRAGVGVRVDDQDRPRLEALVNPPPPSSADPGPERSPAPEGFRVLIVEDNPHIIEMYSYVLKKLARGELAGKVPLEVHFAADGHAALRQLHESRFSLVMTDLYMPVMDGFQLVEKIREEAALATIPVVAISAGGKEAQERAMELGVDLYLRKPVKFVEVLETVKQLLHIR